MVPATGETTALALIAKSGVETPQKQAEREEGVGHRGQHLHLAPRAGPGSDRVNKEGGNGYLQGGDV